MSSTFRIGPLCLLAAFLYASCQPAAPEPPRLEAWWQLDGNRTDAQGATTHTATFHLVNKGRETLRGEGWTLHWNQSPRFVLSTEGPAVVRNINGDWYALEPSADLSLAPGDTMVVRYRSTDFLIKESDGPLGLYIAYRTASGDEATTGLAAYRAMPFDRPEQYTRTPEDQEPYPDPAYLYRRNEAFRVLPAAERHPFLPAPVSYAASGGAYTLPDQYLLSCHPDLEKEARYLADVLRDRFGLTGAVSTEGADQADLVLGLSESVDNPEGYTLAVDAGTGVLLQASAAAGAFYGIQSLLSLAAADAAGNLLLPACSLADAPAIAYRGMHIDVGRNFQSKETVLRLLDMMARYKLNRLQFNLTEDEGWRLDIRGLPELTEVGGRRGHTRNDSLWLQPAYGSGPDPRDAASNGNGFYTREDFKEIIRYAHDRHIEVIPEVNLPGHARAAIKAMELRYRRLMAAGQPEEAERFRLIDPADTSRYVSAQGYFDNTTCVCQPQVLRFFDWVVDDIIAMYREAEVPIRMFHTGGDEVPATAWTGSPICRDFLAAHPEIKDTRNLQGLFFGQMVAHLRDRGLQTGTWEEAVMVFEKDGDWYPNADYVGQEVYPYIWNSLWGNQDLGYRLANAGYPVILCNVTNFYFDLAYNKDPREPGLYWAGFVDTEDAFSFVPYDLFRSLSVDQMGRPFDPAADFEGMERLTPAGRKNIAGLQAQMWSETIKGRQMFEYYYLPKLYGFAQRAWQGQADWADQGPAARLADYNRFLNTVVQVELPFAESSRGGYHFRIPPPGMKAEGGTVALNTEYPGYVIRYTTDGSQPGADSPAYAAPLTVPAGTTVRAACFNLAGRAGLSSTLTIE